MTSTISADPTCYSQLFVIPSGVTAMHQEFNALLLHNETWWLQMFLLSLLIPLSTLNGSLFRTCLLGCCVYLKFVICGRREFFLGIEIVPVDGGFVLSQRRYINDILKRVAMTECKLGQCRLLNFFMIPRGIVVWLALCSI